MQTTEEKVRIGHKPYTEEFKRTVVTHWVESGRSARKVADEFGIGRWNLLEWHCKFAPAPKGPDDPMPETVEQLRAKNRRLRQELARMMAQWEILRKLPRASSGHRLTQKF